LKFSAKLSGVELPVNLAKQLDIAFQIIEPEPKQPEPVRITLDPARVATLQLESQVVIEMLATDQDNAEKAALTDLAEVRTLWKGLNNLERLVLAGLLNKDFGTFAQIEKSFDLEAEKVKSALDSINAKAQPILGDHLVYMKKVSVSLAEDFIDELEVVIKEFPPNSDLLSDNETGSNTDPWMQFFDKLEPVEVEITKLLGQAGRLGETEVEAIARAHNLMGNAVMDSLNEKAQEFLEHLPFYLDGGFWLVEEDDLPVLQHHLGLEVN
jgi:hypothetical protein